MFKVGDKIVCVRVNHFNKPVPTGLTVDKSYEILEIRHDQSHAITLVVFVRDDIGNIFGYSSERFISITEYRKQKLDKICSKLETR